MVLSDSVIIKYIFQCNLINLKNSLNGLGHSYIINDINSIKLNLNTIKQRIHDHCLQTQNANICDS